MRPVLVVRPRMGQHSRFLGESATAGKPIIQPTLVDDDGGLLMFPSLWAALLDVARACSPSLQALQQCTLEDLLPAAELLPPACFRLTMSRIRQSLTCGAVQDADHMRLNLNS